MKKYAIIEERTRACDSYWAAHRYNILFKIFGPNVFTEEYGTMTFKSIEECKRLLRDGKTKYKTIEIITQAEIEEGHESDPRG